MWSIDQPSKPSWTSDPLVPNEILYEYDGPLIFTVNFGAFQALFSRIEEYQTGDIYAVGTVSDIVIDALKRGHLSVRGALLREPCFVIETEGLLVTRYWSCTKEQMPLDLLPASGRSLIPEVKDAADTLEQVTSFFSIRFSGQQLSSSSIPFSIFRHLIDNFHESVRKIMIPRALENTKSATFDFDITEPAIGSLVINIKSPIINVKNVRRATRNPYITEDRVHNDIVDRRRDFFDDLENIVESAREGEISSEVAEENADILNQIVNVIPHSETVFDRVEFNAMDQVNLTKISIEKTVGARLIRAHDAISKKPITLVGTITIINSKQCTFVMQTRNGREVTCSLDEGDFKRLAEDINFRGGAVIEVNGESRRRSRRDFINVSKYKILPRQ